MAILAILGLKPRFVAEGAAERRAAHGDRESPEPERIHPRGKPVGVLAAPASARPATMGRKRRRAAALQMNSPATAFWLLNCHSVRGALSFAARRGAIDFAFARRLAGLGSALSYSDLW